MTSLNKYIWFTIFMIGFIHAAKLFAVGKQKAFLSDSTFNQIVHPSSNIRYDDSLMLRHDLKIEKQFKDNYRERIFDYHRGEELKPKQKQRTKNGPTFNFDWLEGIAQVFIIFLLASMLMFLGYIVFLFVGKPKKPFWVRKTYKKELTAELNAEQELVQLENINFKDRIEELRAAKVWRPIVRLYYLWVLQKMQENEMVSYSREKTDTAYLSDLEEGYFKDQFQELLQIYFRVWYGHQTLSQLQFDIVEEQFKSVLNELD